MTISYRLQLLERLKLFKEIATNVPAMIGRLVFFGLWNAALTFVILFTYLPQSRLALPMAAIAFFIPLILFVRLGLGSVKVTAAEAGLSISRGKETKTVSWEEIRVKHRQKYSLILGPKSCFMLVPVARIGEPAAEFFQRVEELI